MFHGRFNKHFHVIFGEFVHSFDETKNNMVSCTTEVIALGPTGSLQGGIWCYNLETGAILNRQCPEVTIMKMSPSAIQRLNYIARKKKQNKGLIFGNWNNNIDPDDIVIIGAI